MKTTPIYTILLMVAAIFMVGIVSKAQDSTTLKKQYAIAFQPFYMSSGGLRLDFEKRLHNSPQWLRISATGYYIPESWLQDDYNYNHNNDYDYYSRSSWVSMGGDDYLASKGAGLSLGYKWSFDKNERFYLLGEASYTYRDVKYEDYQYVSRLEDGMKFYDYELVQSHQYFNQMGTQACMGVQSNLQRLFFVDCYAGIGYNYSFYNSNKKAFNEGIYNFGYRGLLFVAGFRIGFGFHKK